MKSNLRVILMMMIGVTAFSCSTIKHKVIHSQLTIPQNCIFEKFTESEKQTMRESVGKRIYRNQEACRLRSERINDIIRAHNQEHSK